MIRDDGWLRYSIWEHSSHVRELYARRCRMEEPEMTCAAQAAELLRPHIEPGDTLLDAGCGAGYFYHSLRSRDLPAEYYGIDASPSLIAIGQQLLPAHGLPASRLRVLRIEDLDGHVDHVVCMNVLSNIDNFHRPLERLATCTTKLLILRESIAASATYRYVQDRHLDDDVALRVHVNTYAITDLVGLLTDLGFDPVSVTDDRTQGSPELVIGYPHYWRFIVARRRTAAGLE